MRNMVYKSYNDFDSQNSPDVQYILNGSSNRLWQLELFAGLSNCKQKRIYEYNANPAYDVQDRARPMTYSHLK